MWMVREKVQSCATPLYPYILFIVFIYQLKGYGRWVSMLKEACWEKKKSNIKMLLH